jgi:hypothetical protein
MEDIYTSSSTIVKKRSFEVRKFAASPLVECRNVFLSSSTISGIPASHEQAVFHWQKSTIPPHHYPVFT